MKENLYKQALNEFQIFISSKTRENKKDLIVEAYEGVLTYQRATEKDILN